LGSNLCSTSLSCEHYRQQLISRALSLPPRYPQGLAAARPSPDLFDVIIDRILEKDNRGAGQAAAYLDADSQGTAATPPKSSKLTRCTSQKPSLPSYQIGTRQASVAMRQVHYREKMDLSLLGDRGQRSSY